MIIDVCAHAPSKEIARAFMADVGIAEERDGVLVPLIEAHIDEIGPITKTQATETSPAVMIEGWHVNVRYYGSTAEAVTQGLPQADEAGNLLPLFERTRILQLVSQRTGESMSWSQNAAPLPPGCVNSDGVRLFDCGVLATPSRVWA